MTVIDLFAGPGGWDEAAAQLGIKPVLGFEWDDAACRTAMAAGHARVRADVAKIATAPMVGKVRGVIASPPCQAWSMAGKRKGELDRQHCHDLAERMAIGDDSTDWTAWEDQRSPLVCEPVRFVRDLRPLWVALEEVPAVASLWEHFAIIFRRWGYSVWTGDLNAADYGVPQTRTRRILMASLMRQVQPPPPTHAQDPADDLFGGSTDPWVTMAQALGWGATHRPTPAIHAGKTVDGRLWGSDTHGGSQALIREQELGTWVRRERSGDRAEEGFDAAESPAQCLTSKTRSWLRMGNQEKSAVRSVEEPAPTVVFGARSNKVEWFHERPATTVVGSYCPDVISPPGYRLQESRQNAEGGVRVTVAEGGVRVTVAEGGVLQSFPADYPWQGSRTKQYQQVGNAIPPLLAKHILGSLLGVTSAEAAA
jgi:DNA (cytosine-5)-methyltransferase 1